MATVVSDTLHRPLRDLRISVTDRCNMRCRYCMPREVFGADFRFLPKKELLTFEEITRIASAFVRAGVRKIRITGGEPSLRADLPRLVSMLVGIAGVEDLALTTNGSLLRRLARPLRSAGLHRITVSLDTLDPRRFEEITDASTPLEEVLAGIDAAVDAGFAPLKINVVVRRGMNDDEIELLAEFARTQGHVIRFIEYMDVGSSNGWQTKDVVPAVEIVERISNHWPIEPIDAAYPGEVATRFRYLDGAGEFGVIASITQPFCRACTRARLSAIGEVYTCLFAPRGYDLRSIVRKGLDETMIDAELDAAINRIWARRADRYSELRAHRGQKAPRVEMSYIGG